MWRIVGTIFAAAMAGAAVGDAIAYANLDGTWRLVSVDSRPLGQLPADQVPFFTVTGTTVSGFDGCNSFFGRIDQPGNINATRRGCSEETIKLPLDLNDLRSHLQTGTVDKNSLSVPARGQFPTSMFERSE
jgi:heat shock protein HslJ